MDNPGFNANTGEQQHQQRQEKTPSEENLTEHNEQIRNQESDVKTPDDVSCDRNSSSDSGQGSLDQEPASKGGEKEEKNRVTEEKSGVTEERREKRRADRKPSVTISEDGSKYSWRSDPALPRNRSTASFIIGDVFNEDEEEQEDITTAADINQSIEMGGWDGNHYSNFTEEVYEKPPFKKKFSIYISSTKGRHLTQGASFGYAMILAISCFAIMMGTVIGNNAVGNYTIYRFLIFMNSVSGVILVTLLLLGSFGKLTSNEKYANQKSTSFIRAGMIALGTGGFLFRALVIGGYVLSEDCENLLGFVNAITGFIFTILLMGFLMKYSKIEINRNLGLSIAARFMLMHLVATNLCIWVSVIIEETLVELKSTTNTTADEESISQKIPKLAAPAVSAGCDVQTDLQGILGPYLFPLLVEFCVVASTMLIAIWEKTGDRTELGAASAELGRRMSAVSQGTLASRKILLGSDSSSKQSNSYNSYIGFLIGWLIIIGSITVTLFSLYAIYTDADYVLKVDEIVYGTSLIIGALTILVLPPTLYQMSNLTFKDDEIRRMARGEERKRKGHDVSKALERQLLSITFMALLAYRILCMMASFTSRGLILFADSLVAVVMTGLQTMFCNWFAFHKRATTEEHLAERPGYQGLQFLRCTNFALWLINTLLLKDKGAKEDMINVFGLTGWAILSNIFQPLAILFYFHSFLCMGEILHRSYSKKYIGIVRESKLKRSGTVSRNTSASSLR